MVMKLANTLGVDKMDYVMYSKLDCPYCEKAEAIFNYYNCKVEYRFMPCDDWDTFPAIYKVAGEAMILIGGFDELKKYLQTNEL